MRTEEEIKELYKKVLNELEEKPKDAFEKYLELKIITPTERMLKKERLDMIKALFEWVLESEANND